MHNLSSNYVARLLGLRELLPMVAMSSSFAQAQCKKQHLEFLEKHAQVTSTTGESGEPEARQYAITPEIYQSHVSYLKAIDSYELSAAIIPKSLVVTMVSQYDAFLGRVIHFVFTKRPELLNSCERQLQYSELIRYPSIDSVKEFIIEKEIESVLRKNHYEQICWLEKKLSITLQSDAELLRDFIEITERRNLYVHADGIVSSQYLAAMEGHKIQVEPGVNLGTDLLVSPKYFFAACDRLIEIGVKLAQIVWRNVCPTETAAADQTLTEVTYDLIDRGKYAAAIKILDLFTAQPKKISSEERYLTLLLNLAQAHKWSKHQDKCNELLAKIDWSAKSSKFRLVRAVLKDKHADAAKFMRQIGNDPEVMQSSYYHDWPIFKDFRTSPEFLDAYRDVYAEDFKVRELARAPNLKQMIMEAQKRA